jgi:hypothetical protein
MEMSTITCPACGFEIDPHTGRVAVDGKGWLECCSEFGSGDISAPFQCPHLQSERAAASMQEGRPSAPSDHRTAPFAPQR